MILRPCSGRAEVQQMVARGHWPHACSPQLRAHVATCKACAEFLLLSEVFQQSRTAALAEARLPAQVPSGGARNWPASMPRWSAWAGRRSAPTPFNWA
jgi:Tfp pilus assembly protein FimT